MQYLSRELGSYRAFKVSYEGRQSTFELFYSTLTRCGTLNVLRVGLLSNLVTSEQCVNPFSDLLSSDEVERFNSEAASCVSRNVRDTKPSLCAYLV